MKLSPKVSSLAAATAALALAAFPAIVSAQATPAAPAPAQAASAPATNMIAYSSSDAANPYAGIDLAGQSLTSAPDGTMKVAPQYGGGYGGGHYHRYDQNGGFSHFAFEAGGGFTAPVGNDVSGGFTSLIGDGTNYGAVTWGGNLLVGAGWNFSKRFTLLGEYAYNSNKIPGKTLSALSYYDFASQGITQLGGNVHTQSITVEPMFYYLQNDKSNYSAYVIGGGGWYHKSTNFTTPLQSCQYDYYYGYVCGYYNQTFSSFTDNAGGLNIGTGITFKPFGQNSRAKLFAEARYVFVDTPAFNPNSTSGTPHTGTEELIPVTFGIRF